MRNKTVAIGIVGVVFALLFSTASVLALSLSSTSTEPAGAVMPPAPLPQTGAGVIPGYTLAPGEDGSLRAGVDLPNPRFITGTTGVVTDSLTGLIWLQNANCRDTVGDVAVNSSGTLSWTNALTWTNNLAAGSCGLADGSSAGDWRLPNVRELESLIYFGFYNPALSNAMGTEKWAEGDPFIGIQQRPYWSSTTAPNFAGSAYNVSLTNGLVGAGLKSFANSVWAVRDSK
jgi:hypothetical protein